MDLMRPAVYTTSSLSFYSWEFSALMCWISVRLSLRRVRRLVFCYLSTLLVSFTGVSSSNGRFFGMISISPDILGLDYNAICKIEGNGFVLRFLVTKRYLILV
jgi:hypothetical protein